MEIKSVKYSTPYSDISFLKLKQTHQKHSFVLNVRTDNIESAIKTIGYILKRKCGDNDEET